MRDLKLIRPIYFLLFIAVAQFVHADKYDDALNDSRRPEADRGRDELREPARVLRTIGVEPGLTVLDMMAGDGYYSQILATLVGERGRVLIQNPSILYTRYYPQLQGAVAERLASNSLDNTSELTSEVTDLDLDNNSVDMVFLHLVYHDLYWIYPGQAAQFDTEIARVVKPGGRVVIIDHHAPDGTGAQHVGAMAEGAHRIDAAFVQDAIEKAGLKLIQSYDFLENNNDDRTQSFFSESLRGKKTDRFFQVYQK